MRGKGDSIDAPWTNAKNFSRITNNKLTQAKPRDRLAVELRRLTKRSLAFALIYADSIASACLEWQFRGSAGAVATA